MVLVEFSMFPTDVGESKSKYVAQVLDEIDKSGLNYKLTPMSTIIEGEWDEVMALIGKCYHTLETQANRVYTTIKVDARKGDKSRLTSKIESVQSKLGRDLKH